MGRGYALATHRGHRARPAHAQRRHGGARPDGTGATSTARAAPSPGAHVVAVARAPGPVVGQPAATGRDNLRLGHRGPPWGAGATSCSRPRVGAAAHACTMTCR